MRNLAERTVKALIRIFLQFYKTADMNSMKTCGNVRIRKVDFTMNTTAIYVCFVNRGDIN